MTIRGTSKWLTFASGLIAGAVVTGAASAWAAEGETSISVMFRNISLVVGGVPVKSPDEPFIYKGRTYVPLRTAAEALGVQVGWDGDNWRVLLNSSPDDLPLSELPLIDRSKEAGVAAKSIRGVEYPNALWIPNHVAYCSSCFQELALDGRYTKLSAVVGLADNAAYEDIEVKVLIDDKEVSRFKVFKGSKPVPVNLNIKGGLKINISTPSSYFGSHLVIAGSVSK